MVFNLWLSFEVVFDSDDSVEDRDYEPEVFDDSAETSEDKGGNAVENNELVAAVSPVRFARCSRGHGGSPVISSLNVVSDIDGVVTRQYISKDRDIKWFSESAVLPRNRAESIITGRIGVSVHAAMEFEKIRSAFKLSFGKCTFYKVLLYTNKEGAEKMKDAWVPIDETTLWAYFGLLKLAGVTRSYGKSLR